MNKLNEDRYYTVCDANGVCLGIFLFEKDANEVADYSGAYVSKCNVIKELPTNWKDHLIHNGRI